MEVRDLETTAAFIRDHRANEANFEKLYNRLETEIQGKYGAEKYVSSLQEIKEKSASEYKKAKETGSAAWLEFEKFVTQFERAVVNAK